MCYKIKPESETMIDEKKTIEEHMKKTGHHGCCFGFGFREALKEKREVRSK